jgi:hypothetical protein
VRLLSDRDHVNGRLRRRLLPNRPGQDVSCFFPARRLGKCHFTSSSLKLIYFHIYISAETTFLFLRKISNSDNALFYKYHLMQKEKDTTKFFMSSYLYMLPVSLNSDPN